MYLRNIPIVKTIIFSLPTVSTTVVSEPNENQALQQQGYSRPTPGLAPGSPLEWESASKRDDLASFWIQEPPILPHQPQGDTYYHQDSYSGLPALTLGVPQVVVVVGRPDRTDFGRVVQNRYNCNSGFDWIPV